MSSPSTNLIGEAVYENRPASLGGLSDRIFARLFQGLVYPQIWEDPVCDMAALGLSDTDDMVCIASGGCNVISYLTAQPRSITAVDLSPWHVELNRLKLAAAQHLPDHAAFFSVFGNGASSDNPALLEAHVLPKLDAEGQAFWRGRMIARRRLSLFARGFYRFGVLGRFLGTIHLLTRLAGVDFDRLLAARSLAEQRAFFEQEIAPLYETRLVRFLAHRRASLFGLGIPPAQYDKLAGDAGGDIVPVLRERTRKLFCDFPISENYFAWQAAKRRYGPLGTAPLPPYLERRAFDRLRTAARRVTVLNQSVTEVLARAETGSKSVFVLLDAQDWMTDEQLNALWQEITRTARQGARVLFRTGGADDILPGRVAPHILAGWHYDVSASAEAFATDRSAIYGGVHLYRRRG